MLGLIVRVLFIIVLKIIQAVCLLTSITTCCKKPKRCPPIYDQLLLNSASSLAEKIRKRKITSEEIVRCYIRRIKAINPILNVIVEDRFEDAIKDAQNVDHMLSSTKLTEEELAVQYPLLGLPLTIKESIAVKGLSHAAGRVFPGGRKATEDANVVKLCKDAGGIPLLVSNTPELCINSETYNNVTGTTCNPYDTRRTCGGSSGGEGALLGAGASVLGIGSDIFGSVRIPANYCCVWGHKPSPYAVSVEGHYPSCKNKQAWNEIFVLGPMVRYAVDLPLLLNVLLEKGFHKQLRLNEPVEVKDIKFYFMENNGGSIITRSVDREIVNAMRNLVTYLKIKHQCHMQEVHIPKMKYSPEVSYLKLSGIDDIENLFDNNGNGSFKELLRFIIGKSDSVAIPVLYGVIRKMYGCLPNSTAEFRDNIIAEIKKEFYTLLGEDGVFLYPSYTKPASIHNQTLGTFPDCGYTGIFNFIGFPVTNCPLGLNSRGLPIGIQVVASPNNDRLTIAVAQEIEKGFGGWIPPIFAEELVAS